MRSLTTLLLLISYSLAQQPYGLSQLDNYSRLLNSGNLNGMGALQNAIQTGRIRSLADLNGPSKLSGLPPLPPTASEMQQALSRPIQPLPTIRTPVHSQPTPPPKFSPIIGAYAVNPIPELPPVPEEKLKGYFDNDGNFVLFSQLNGNKIQGTRLHQPSRTVQKKEVIEDYMNDDYYDDPSLKLKVMPQIKTTITRVEAKRPPFITPPQVAQRQIAVPQVVQPIARTMPFIPTTPAPPPAPVVTFPPFVYRPKPKSVGREPYFDNVLQEVEEYDDFLDQAREYSEHFPYARPPINPYLQLHPGQLLPPLFQRGVTIDNTGYVKPLENQAYMGQYENKPAVSFSQDSAPVVSQQSSSSSSSMISNLFPQSQGMTNTATENPLMNLFRIFEFKPPQNPFPNLFGMKR